MTETTSHLEHIDDLVYLSHSVSSQAICGEGNVSMRGDDGFYIKASGTTLEDLKWEDTVILMVVQNQMRKENLVWRCLFMLGSIELFQK